MIELKECCIVPYPEKLFEHYEVKGNTIYANVSASKVPYMMKRFAEIHNEPLFFILELPSKRDNEIGESKRIINANDDVDIFFIDRLDAEQICQYVDALGELLVKDGMNTFGIGGYNSHEEIMFGKYNVMTLYTRSPERYHNFLNDFGIEKTDTLITAWDTFDKEHPGECTLYVCKETGKTVYDIPEAYKKHGMYLYEAEYKETDEKPTTFEDLVGKVLLVGITYYTHENEFIERKQFYGTVIEANESGIRIKQKDEKVFSLPPDLSSTKRARPGEYKLRATGEVVVDPDFLATWDVVNNENN